MTDVVGKLWGFCHTLRHDGIDYGDYIEQITYLLFLKMAEEKAVEVPSGCDWTKLREKSGTDLTEHYIDVLRTLGKQPGILGDIYSGAQSRFANPVNLKRLVNLIDETEWTSLGVDVKAEAYEGLLEKAASEGKKGAGQYFTPRVLIQSMVRCLKPDPRAHPNFTIADPACGTGGFLVAAYEWLMEHTKGGALDRDVSRRIRKKTYFGSELVARPRRMALMNLFLHGVEPHIELQDTIDQAPAAKFDVILANPPFGTKGANTAPDRDDFTVSTSSKQLNFLQHFMTVLKEGGRAGVVLPDNCLCSPHAGEVIKVLTEDCNLHTVLRLPRGTFTPYSQGVDANVVFFTKGEPTRTIWVYDARTSVPKITKVDRPLTTDHFAEFEHCYGDEPNGRAKRKTKDSREDRWRSFSIQELRERDFKLDGFKWLKEVIPENLNETKPAEALAIEAISGLHGAAANFNSLIRNLEGIESPDPSEEDEDLPEGWVWAKLTEVFQVNPSKPKADDYPNELPVAFVPMPAVDAVSGTILTPSIRPFAEVRKGFTAFRDGDVILAKITPCMENGKAAIARGLQNGLGFGSTEFHVFRHTGVVLAEYLFYFVRQVSFRNAAEAEMTGTVGQKRVPSEYLKSVDLPVPPLAEQVRIIGAIGKYFEQINEATAKIHAVANILGYELEQHKGLDFTQAILAKAFRGELVPTEAELARRENRSYEPASELLARIRSTAVTTPKTKGTRKVKIS